MSAFKHWFLATRPKTLVAAIIPVVCATALAIGMFSFAHIDLLTTGLILLATICIQIGTNLINDAIDHCKGADTENRLGPKRMTQSGMLHAKHVMQAGFVFFGLAVIFGIPLALIGGFPIVLIGLISILLGYCYTGGPYPIAYKGLGEVFVFLFFGFTAVCGTYYLLLHESISLEALILSIQIGGLSSVILAVNNYRDHVTDKKAKKMTLAARFGSKFARYEIASLFLLVFVFNIFWLDRYGFKLFMFANFAVLPAYFVVQGVFKYKPSPILNRYLGLAALTELVFGICMATGFLLI